MRAVRVSRKLHNVSFLEAKDVLESTTDVLQDLEGLVGRTALAAFANRPRPQTNTVESLPDIHDHSHHLVIAIVLESLANSGQLGVQPEVIDRHGTLVFERVRPLATVLVLGVFPLWADALLEEVVVCLQAQFRSRCDVVLSNLLARKKKPREARGEKIITYVDSPELLYRVESHDFLQQVIPVIALAIQVSQLNDISPFEDPSLLPYLAARGLCEPQSPLVHQRMLHSEVVWVMEHSNRLPIRLFGLLFGGTGGGIFVVGRDGTVFCDGSHNGRECDFQRLV